MTAPAIQACEGAAVAVVSAVLVGLDGPVTAPAVAPDALLPVTGGVTVGAEGPVIAVVVVDWDVEVTISRYIVKAFQLVAHPRTSQLSLADG